MDDNRHGGPGWGVIGAAVVGIVMVIAASLFLMGGQVSTILSNVGNSIPIVGAAPGGDPPPPDEAIDPNEGQIADSEAGPPELLIIRTGALEIEVVDVETAVAAGRERIAAIGGYVSASEETGAEDDASATAVYRVPADRWDEALDAIRGLASETRHLQVATEAVTNQVVDLGARIANLRSSEAALQAIMAQATRIQDVLDVQAKLTDVRGEIERLVAEKGLLEEQAAFGTLTVMFVLPTAPAVVIASEGWDPAADVDQASGRLIAIGQAAVSVAIWMGIVGLPLLIAGALILAVGLWLVRLAGRVWGSGPEVPSV